MWHSAILIVASWHMQCGTVPHSKGNVADSTWHVGRLERRASRLRASPRVETSYLPIGGVVEFVSLLPDCLTPAAPYQEARQEQERLSCRLPNTSGGWNKPSHAQTATQRQPRDRRGVAYELYIVYAIDLYGGP